MKRHLVVEVISLLFIVLFVYAAVAKLLDYEKFAIQIGQSPLLTNFAGFAAWFIPAVEISIALMLAFQKVRLIALYAAFGLMIMFTTYIFVILNFSDHIPCSCGGVLEKLGWREHMVFNIVFVLLALTGIVLLSGKQQAAGTVAIQQ